MAKTFNASLDLKAWKQHCCVGCALPYAYVLDRKVTATGSDEAKAQANLQTAVEKTLTTEVDSRACPNCGLVQPDMIADSRNTLHTFLFLGSLGVLIVIAILKATYAVQSTTLSIVAIVLAVIIAALHVLAELKNPNRDLDGNKKSAADLIAKGEMHVPPEAKPQRTGPVPAELVQPKRPVTHLAGLVLAAVCVVLVALPELLRVGKGSPVNDEVYPAIVGPGDTTRIYMGQSLESVKGYWRGTVSARLTADGMAPMEVSGKTNSNTWGDSISVKSSEKSSTIKPWVELRMPDDEKLAGKTVKAEIKLSIIYPKMIGGSSYEEFRSEMVKSEPLVLASPGAGSSYNSAWWFGTACGLAGLVVAAFLFKAANSTFAKTALPATVLG